MITVNINDPELERVYHGFNDNDEKFVEYLSLRASANNVEYGLDAQMIEAAYDEAEGDGSDDIDHEEVFERLRQKYDIDKIW